MTGRAALPTVRTAVEVSPRVAYLLFNLCGLGQAQRDLAGKDVELNLTLLALRRAATHHIDPVPDSGHSPTASASPGRLVSTTEAALALGVDTTTIRRRIRSGKLPAELIGARWAIDTQHLAA